MNNYYGIIVQQCNNEYRLWSPQGIGLAHIILPPDGQYILDSKALDLICKVVAKRWEVAK